MMQSNRQKKPAAARKSGVNITNMMAGQSSFRQTPVNSAKAVAVIPAKAVAVIPAKAGIQLCRHTGPRLSPG